MTERRWFLAAFALAACGDSANHATTTSSDDASSDTTSTSTATTTTHDVVDDSQAPTDGTSASDALSDASTSDTRDATAPSDTSTQCVTCGPYGEVLSAICDLHARCPAQFYPIAYRDHAECMAVFGFVLTCHLTDDEVDDVHHYGVSQRVPGIDEAQASACSAWLATADCAALDAAFDDDDDDDESVSEPGPCHGLVVAAEEEEQDDYYAAAGESCESRSCRDGLYCKEATLDADGIKSCAVCTPLPTVGETCAKFGHCAGDLFCDSDGTCATKRAAGGECFGDDACVSGFCQFELHQCSDLGHIGEACSSNNDCRTRLCDIDVCIAYKQNGEPCTRAAQCAFNVCLADRCGGPLGSSCQFDDDCADRCDESHLTCVARLELGATCSVDSDCVSRDCDEFQHVCVERCVDDHDCDADEYCSWSSQTCITHLADGFACDDDGQCESGYCRPNDDVCGEPPALGDSCGQSYECYPLGFCQGGQCVAKKDAGAACEALDSCKDPMLCVDGTCQMMNLECRPAAVGELCAWLRVCEAGAFCDILGGFVCAPLRAAAEDCLRSEDCGAGLRCVSGADGRVCQTRAAAGEACREGADCAEALHCIADGPDEDTCQAGPAGQPCDRYDPESACPAGYSCGYEDQCLRLAEDGEECGSFAAECAAGLFCDSAACRPRGGDGASCRWSEPEGCQDAFHCTLDGQCVLDVPLDGECESFPEGACALGLTCEYIEAEQTSRCRPGAGFGEYCYQDDQCASGVCDDELGCVSGTQCLLP